MTKTEHLQFLLLLIPTFLVLVAAAVCVADLGLPPQQDQVAMAEEHWEYQP